MACPICGSPTHTEVDHWKSAEGQQGLGVQPIGTEQYLGEIQKAAPAAQQIAGALGEATTGGAPPLGEFIEPTVKASLESLMQGGMTPEEYDVGRGRVTQGFQRAIGGLAATTARRGYYAPHSVAGAAMGGPSRALAGGLAELEAQRAAMKQRSIGQAGQIAAGLFQYPAQAQQAQQQATGEVLGSLLPPVPTWAEAEAAKKKRGQGFALKSGSPWGGSGGRGY